MEEPETKRGRPPLDPEARRAHISAMVPLDVRQWIQENAGKGKPFRSVGQLIEKAVEALRSSNKE